MGEGQQLVGVDDPHSFRNRCLEGLEGVSLSDQEAGPGVLEPVAEGILPKQRGKRQGDGPQLVHRQVREGALQRLAQEEPNPLPPRDANPFERVCQPV